MSSPHPPFLASLYYYKMNKTILELRDTVLTGHYPFHGIILEIDIGARFIQILCPGGGKVWINLDNLLGIGEPTDADPPQT